MEEGCGKRAFGGGLYVVLCVYGCRKNTQLVWAHTGWWTKSRGDFYADGWMASVKKGGKN